MTFNPTFKLYWLFDRNGESAQASTVLIGMQQSSTRIYVVVYIIFLFICVDYAVGGVETI